MAGICAHQLGAVGVAGDPGSRVHRLDPRAKIAGLATVTLVAVSTPVERWPVYAICAAALVAIATASRVPAREIWRRARVVLPLVLFVAAFVPFVRTGGSAYDLGPLSVSTEGLKTFAEVSAKATIGTVAAVLLGATTAFQEVLRGLEAMRAPRLLVAIAGFMYRYLFVIVDEVQRMRIALASRGYRPRHMLHSGAIGRVVTALFLRSYGRGERVYLAMAARGYRGSMPQLAELRFRPLDAAFVAAMGIVLVGSRALVEVLW
jgi:cobalt/nickel transport system permease protein